MAPRDEELKRAARRRVTSVGNASGDRFAAAGHTPCPSIRRPALLWPAIYRLRPRINHSFAVPVAGGLVRR